MANLELTEKEATLLTEVLQSSLSDLRTERVRTDKRDLHAWFLEREHVVADVLKRLESQIMARGQEEFAQIPKPG